MCVGSLFSRERSSEMAHFVSEDYAVACICIGMNGNRGLLVVIHIVIIAQTHQRLHSALSSGMPHSGFEV